MAWLTTKKLVSMGFGKIGNNVLLSDKASFYNCSNIFIGNNVRVDDYCVISAGLDGVFIGNYIHIATYCSILGQGRVVFNDFSGLSSRVSIYSSSDDYSGKFMTNPMVPDECRGVTHSEVIIGRHVIIGAGSVVLPGVHLGDGVAVGALSLIRKNCESFSIYSGNPAKRIGDRSIDFLAFEKRLN